MSAALLSIPSAAVRVREATPADVPFVDRLQKLHSKMVGFMPSQQLAGKMAAREVLIAQEGGGDSSPAEPVGYVIGADRYFKRDDVGIIYQLNVAPGRQRSFVGMTLLMAMFDRAAYGCR